MFNDAETYNPNLFLVNGDDDDDIGTHQQDCFCRRCRDYYKSLIEGNYGNTVEERAREVRELGDKMIVELPGKLRAAKKKVFTINKNIIVNGKIFKDVCLSGTDYVQFKSWATLQPRYEEYVHGNKQGQKEFNNHCQLINDCANVFESWEDIVKHLTNESITHLDARTFSINKFRRAKSWVWCVSENERAIVRSGKRKRPAEQLWTSQDVSQAARYLLGVNRLREADVHQTAQFCQQVEKQCLAIVNRNQQQQINRYADSTTDQSNLDADSTTDQSNLQSP